MTQATANLDTYLATIQEKGSILSEKLARNWSESTLKMMGLYMNKSGKKALSDKLPQTLSDDLNRVFRLMHFPNPNMPMLEFQQMVARRAGYSDPQFAKMAITAVFHALKKMIDNQTSQQVAEALSPEIRAVWNDA